ncbi:hypothetical protein KFE25_001387 [Diacronema lutheri]|uniref:Uncharacterized protein n=1 Tax=Diacronema lutheri TaxID=2081491 RepID=A0A8J6C697_DIALT|nr:hypothetical protein KFE25_001387 [Diacronema lutheri]
MADVEAGASYSLEPRPNDRVRLLVIGDGGSGKSSLIYLACQGAVLRGAKATIGCHVDAKLHNHHGASFLVEFVEVGGAEKFRSARSVFFMLRFDGVVMLHDMTNRNSRANLDRWRRELVAVRDEGGADRDARRSSHQHARAADGGLGAHAAEPRDGACDAPRPWPPPTERSASGSLSRRHGGGAAGSGEWVDAGEMGWLPCLTVGSKLDLLAPRPPMDESAGACVALASASADLSVLDAFVDRVIGFRRGDDRKTSL